MFRVTSLGFGAQGEQRGQPGQRSFQESLTPNKIDKMRTPPPYPPSPTCRPPAQRSHHRCSSEQGTPPPPTPTHPTLYQPAPTDAGGVPKKSLTPKNKGDRWSSKKIAFSIPVRKGRPPAPRNQHRCSSLGKEHKRSSKKMAHSEKAPTDPQPLP